MKKAKILVLCLFLLSSEKNDLQPNTYNHHLSLKASMKRIYFLTIYLCITLLSYSQDTNNDRFETLLQMGKEIFTREFDDQNYEEAIRYLEMAVEMQPENTEARYFLGYAYGRLNSKHGVDIVNMSLPRTIKTSEQFEIINKLTPKYEGEYLLIDPYSKITSEWATLSICYDFHNQPDSAIWACEEGKRRGGFSEYYLCNARKILDMCPKNAILFTSGDAMSLPIWYIQLVEKKRTDVAAITRPLLNTVWYPKMLEEKNIISFGLPDMERDTLNYLICHEYDPTISLKIDDGDSFIWEKKGHSEDYLYRGDRLFLKILEQNKFRRDVYFTSGLDPEDLLGLDYYMDNHIHIIKLNRAIFESISDKEYDDILSKSLDCIQSINPNSPDEEKDIARIRFSVYERIISCIEKGNVDEGRRLFRILEDKLNRNFPPDKSEHERKNYEYIKKRLFSHTGL